MNRASIGAMSFAGSIVGCDVSRENFSIGDEIAVQSRRQLDREPDRLVVLNWTELELRHALPVQPA